MAYRPHRRSLARPVALATTTAVLASCISLSTVPAIAASGGEPPALFVSEIVADNAADDNFEYFEVTNMTDQAVALADAGISFAYAYDDSAATGTAIPLAVEGEVSIAAGESVVFWLSYTSGAVDSTAHSLDDFREHTGAAADTQVHRITGQSGFANGGNRAVRILDADGVMTWSFYPSGSVAKGLGAEFRAPSTLGSGATVLRQQAAYTPGAIAEDQLPWADPSTPEGPEDATGLLPDPDVVGAPLQITEVLPDSTNVGTGDGYEFIEIFNASSESVDFADYALSYLYPIDSQTNSSEALWPVSPRSVEIPAGETLVAWIKNGANASLTDADFNRFFGSDLTLGEDLVEISSGGMANGSARGIALRTNTGLPVNRAYYNMDGADDTVADQGIRYTRSEDTGLQSLLDVRAATPGRVQTDQVATGLVVVAPDTTDPVVDDRTAGEIDSASDFTIDLHITDDTAVRTVEIELTNSADSTPTVINLLDAGEGEFAHVVHAADLTGKRWYEYTVRVSDGTNEVRTDTVRVPVAGTAVDPVRLNVADGDIRGGTATVSAAGEDYPSPITMSIDGTKVDTRASLEHEPLFVFEVSQTDYYFRNGVRIGEQILHIFDEGTYADTETLAVPVPLDHITQGEPLTVSVWAGTKAGPWIDENENNDDFVISGLRLVLPDGRTLRPAGYDDPTQLLNMGDSAGKYEFFDAVFTIPDDGFRALAHDWDTTTVADGIHEILATSGTDRATASVTVDNTAPTVALSVQDGQAYQGSFALDAEITDAASFEVVSLLDGEPIELGHSTSSTALKAGEHVFSVTATDAAGNTTTSSATFVIPEEHPGSDGFAPDDGSEVEAGDVILQATVTDPTDDTLDVSFREGSRVELGDDAVRAVSGTTRDAAAVDRAETLTADELETIEGLAPVVSETELPYQLFDVDVPTQSPEGTTTRLTWSGTADADAQVILYALTSDGTAWVEIDRHLTTADDEEFTLTGSAVLADHVSDGVVRALVQHSEGFAGADLSTRESEVTPNNEADTPRSDYDFTIAWESDTQYYNEQYVQHQSAIHDFVLDQREEQNIQYLIHTGDIVNVAEQQYQWENADEQYARLDAAGLPYGVLAGNHDVGHGSNDYTAFSTYFGENRYDDNPWYGGSFQDNRGHYDLFTAGGIDFITVYMGWAPQQEAIDWMNEVLAKHPERTAIINLHEYMLTTGGLGPIPQKIYDEVVATNPNVELVFSGHYHDAFTRVDELDDDGDGVADRNVHAMLFDYQGLPEGGLGFLRLLQFDNDGGTMRVRTYSPSLDQYNYDEPSLLGPEEDPYMYQDFTVSYADLGIAPSDKRLATSAFSAEVLTSTEIGVDRGLASGSIATAVWPLTDLGQHGWYVHVSDEHGGVSDSRVQQFTLIEAPVVEVPEPAVSLGAASVAAGGTVRVSVTGFPANTEIAFALEDAGAGLRLFAATAVDGSPIGTLLTDAQGAAEGGITVPSDTAAGSYVLRASSAEVTASTTIDVTASESGSGGVDGGSGGTDGDPDAQPDGSGGANADASADGSLATTGLDGAVWWYALAAILLLAGGGALVVRSRRLRG